MTELHAVSKRLYNAAYRTCTPITATIELTLKCNLRCVHCYNFDRALPRKPAAHGQELARAEVLSAIDQLADAGALYLYFTGGEPLLHPELDTFIRHARARGFSVKVKTNGTLLDEDRLKRLAEAGLAGVDISVYGATPATHDAFTLKPGSFVQTLQSIMSAQDAGLVVALALALVKSNAHEIGRMLGIARQFKVSCGVDPQLKARYDGCHGPLDQRVDRDTLLALYRGPIGELATTRECNHDRSVHCNCARTTCAVSATGDVYPCIGAPIACGNLREHSFAHIWANSAELRRIRGLELDDFATCKPCPDRPFCRRSSGVAYLNTGDYTGPEAWTCMEASVLRQVYEEEQERSRAGAGAATAGDVGK